MVNGVALVQNYDFGSYLGALEVTFDEDGTLLQAEGNPILLDASVAEDDEIKSLVTEKMKRPD